MEESCFDSIVFWKAGNELEEEIWRSDWFTVCKLFRNGTKKWYCGNCLWFEHFYDRGTEESVFIIVYRFCTLNCLLGLCD